VCSGVCFDVGVDDVMEWSGLNGVESMDQPVDGIQWNCIHSFIQPIHNLHMSAIAITIAWEHVLGSV